MPPNPLGAWTFDAATLTFVLIVGAGWLLLARRIPTKDAPTRAQWCSLIAASAVAVLSTCSAIGVYAPSLFWVRALQVLLLLYVVPFLIVLSRPISTLRAAVGEESQHRIDAILASSPIRLLLSPPATSILMLATPWLLYLTPWYVASMSGPLAALTQLVLIVVGCLYFYARLQVDPVPHRYPPLMSIGISVAEGLGDGILGVVLWLGPVVAYDYYAGLHRDFGPSIRTDQTIGAGILWILGDVLGLPFLMLLMKMFGAEERRKGAEIDSRLDREESSATPRAVGASDAPVPSGLWWESDPRLRDRYR